MPTARLDFEFLDRAVTPVNFAFVRVGADNFAAGREVIQLAPVHCGRGRALTAEMPSERDVVRDLPEERAVGFPERHEHGFMTLQLGIARLVIVGGDVYFAARNGRTAVRVAAQLSHPLDVLAFAFFDAPVNRDVSLDSVDHVAARRAAEHGPRALGFGLRRCGGDCGAEERR